MKMGWRVRVGIIGLVASAASGGLVSAAAAVAPSASDTARAAEALAAAIDAAGRSNDSLASCPVSNLPALVAKAPAALGISTAVNDPKQTSFTQLGSTTITCSLFDGETFATIFMGEPFRGDLKESVSSVLADGFTTAFGPVVTVGGGDLLVYCATPLSGADGSFCEADWMDDNVIYGTAAFSPTVNAQLVGTWLASILDDLNGALIGGASGSDGVLDTAFAAGNFAEMLDDARAEASSDGRLSLDTCPYFATVDGVLAKAPSGVSTAALGGPLTAQFFPLGDQTAIACLTEADPVPTIVFGTATRSQRDHHDVVTSLAAGPLTFAADQEVRGGTQVTYCETNKVTQRQNYCESDWLGDGVQYVLWVGTPTVTAEQTSAWLQAMLDDLNAATATATIGPQPPKRSATPPAPSGDAPATSAALANLRVLTSDAKAGNSTFLPACPWGPHSQFMATAPQGVPPNLASGETTTAIISDTSSFCVTATDGVGMNVSAAPAPTGDLRQAVAGGETAAVFDADRQARGGTVVTYCVSAPVASCQASWTDGTMLYGLRATFAGVTGPLVAQWLLAALDGFNASVTAARLPSG